MIIAWDDIARGKVALIHIYVGSVFSASRHSNSKQLVDLHMLGQILLPSIKEEWSVYMGDYPGLGALAP